MRSLATGCQDFGSPFVSNHVSVLRKWARVSPAISAAATVAEHARPAIGLIFISIIGDRKAFLSVARLDDACSIAEFVGVPLTDDHFDLQARRPIGIS
jgi:hypothetical protein